jgi:type IV pilus assembly protein PilM
MIATNINSHTNSKSRFKGFHSPIGLDLGSKQIKIIQLYHNRGNVTIYEKAITATPSGSIREGQILDQKLLIEKLIQIKRKLKFMGNRINLCLGAQAYYLRMIKIPPLSEKEIKLAMRWEVEKHFPLNADDAAFDYCPASPIKKALKGKGSYILAATAKTTADAYTEIAAKAGFNPTALEILPLSLLRLYRYTLPSADLNEIANIFLLDIGFENSTLTFTRNRTLHFQRQLKFGVKYCIRQAASLYSCDPGQAQKLLFSTEFAEKRGVESTVAMLAEQVAQSISYWFDQIGLRGNEPAKLILSGGGAAIPGLGSYLEKKLSAQISYHRFPTNDRLNKAYSDNGFNFNQSLYAAAYGLALRGWVR